MRKQPYARQSATATTCLRKFSASSSFFLSTHSLIHRHTVIASIFCRLLRFIYLFCHVVQCQTAQWWCCLYFQLPQHFIFYLSFAPICNLALISACHFDQFDSLWRICQIWKLIYWNIRQYLPLLVLMQEENKKKTKWISYPEKCNRRFGVFFVFFVEFQSMVWFRFCTSFCTLSKMTHLNQSYQKYRWLIAETVAL